MPEKEAEVPQPAEAPAIRVTAKGEGVVSIKDLTPFQGKFKVLDEQGLWKLKQQILEVGFCSPVLVWKNGEKKYIIDGHERVAAVQDMLDKGEVKLDDLSVKRKESFMVPVCYCYPEDMKQAKQMVLAVTSQFGRVSKRGLKKFIAGTKHHDEDIQVCFRFPDLLRAEDDEEGEDEPKKKKKDKGGEGGDVDEGKRMKNVTCPNCGTKFRTPA
jgi:hypothetical protein